MNNLQLSKLLCVIFFSIFFFACSQKKEIVIDNSAAEELQLMEADQHFSGMSKKMGVKAAFIEYLDSNGVLLRPHSLPLSGANAIDYLIQQDDEGVVLARDPRHAAVAKSGEMGFTYGIFALRFAQSDSLLMGTYSTVWKKQQDGKWKLWLDISNEGIGK